LLAWLLLGLLFGWPVMAVQPEPPPLFASADAALRLPAAGSLAFVRPSLVTVSRQAPLREAITLNLCPGAPAARAAPRPHPRLSPVRRWCLAAPGLTASSCPGCSSRPQRRRDRIQPHYSDPLSPFQEKKPVKTRHIGAKLALSLIAVALLVGCGGGGRGGSGAQDVTVQGLDSFAFDPATLTASVGQAVNVVFENVGVLEHNFVIDELNVRLGPIQGGQENSGSFTPGAAGSYTYYCDVPGHREAGMVGTLTVNP
jgi:plastocyanin